MIIRIDIRTYLVVILRDVKSVTYIIVTQTDLLVVIQFNRVVDDDITEVEVVICIGNSGLAVECNPYGLSYVIAKIYIIGLRVLRNIVVNEVRAAVVPLCYFLPRSTVIGCNEYSEAIIYSIITLST
jgi:hypothetical protein